MPPFSEIDAARPSLVEIGGSRPRNDLYRVARPFLDWRHRVGGRRDDLPHHVFNSRVSMSGCGWRPARWSNYALYDFRHSRGIQSCVDIGWPAAVASAVSANPRTIPRPGPRPPGMILSREQKSKDAADAFRLLRANADQRIRFRPSRLRAGQAQALSLSTSRGRQNWRPHSFWGRRASAAGRYLDLELNTDRATTDRLRSRQSPGTNSTPRQCRYRSSTRSNRPPGQA